VLKPDAEDGTMLVWCLAAGPPRKGLALEAAPFDGGRGSICVAAVESRRDVPSENARPREDAQRRGRHSRRMRVVSPVDPASGCIRHRDTQVGSRPKSERFGQGAIFSIMAIVVKTSGISAASDGWRSNVFLGARGAGGGGDGLCRERSRNSSAIQKRSYRDGTSTWKANFGRNRPCQKVPKTRIDDRSPANA